MCPDEWWNTLTLTNENPCTCRPQRPLHMCFVKFIVSRASSHLKQSYCSQAQCTSYGRMAALVLASVKATAESGNQPKPPTASPSLLILARSFPCKLVSQLHPECASCRLRLFLLNEIDRWPVRILIPRHLSMKFKQDRGPSPPR